MKFKWTDAQEEAVYADISNTLVTAAAGSGKTQVLTGRILERIKAGQDVDRLLIVTFTNAAAAEMRGRIAKTLSEYLRQNTADTHVRRQLAMMPCANITTIHSFCLNVIRENFFELSLPADFRIGDTAENELLKLEAVDDALEELYGEAEPDFLAFADAFSSPRTDDDAVKAIMQVYSFSRSMPDPDAWLTEAENAYDPENVKISDCTEIILNSARKKLLFLAEDFKTALSHCTEINGLASYREHIENEIAEIESVIPHTERDKFRDEVLRVSTSFTRIPTLKKGTFDEEEKAYVTDVRNKVKKGVSDILGLFPEDSETAEKTLRLCGAAVRGLISAVRRFDEKYTAAKRGKNVIDYNDMEHMCISLLHKNGAPTPVAERLRDHFDEIYIDEYQDSNEAQEFIFSLISRESAGVPNIFMVGDLKQGIYGFRQASPHLFAEKKQNYKKGPGQPYRKIVLSQNFRSAEKIIDFVNLVFSSVMTPETGGVSYDAEEELIFGAKSYPSDTADVCITLAESSGSASESFLREAEVISAKIAELIKSETVFDIKSGSHRAVRFSDIAILIRNAKNKAAVLERVLTSHGIPCYTEKGSPYFENTEVKTFLSLLETIDNPRCDIPLLAVLRSPIGKFDESELAKIRLCDTENCFFDAFTACARESSDLGEKCNKFCEKLSEWRKKASEMPCGELIEFLLTDTEYIYYILADSRGKQREANLRMLCEMARMYEKTSFKGLFGFIEYISRVREKPEESNSAKIINDSHNVVKIMTIHKSKGLEFPIVFLADGTKTSGSSSDSKPPVLHKTLGISMPYFDGRMRTKRSTERFAAAKLLNALEMNSEEMRVLYVALTRPKEKLFITGYSDSLQKSKDRWRRLGKMIAEHKPLPPLSYLDCICACASLADCPPLSDGMKKLTRQKIIFDVYPSGFTAEDIRAANIKPSEINPEDAERAISYIYPHKDLLNIPTKISVTEMKRIVNLPEDERRFELFRKTEPKTPRFMLETNALNAAQRGTLIHLVMQTVSLEAETEADVKHHVRELCEKNIITEQMAKAVPCSKIALFLQSSLGKRLKKADKVYREEAFTTILNASSVIPSAPDSPILCQGIIDCYFFEGDKITLIDFKTDRVTDVEAIKNRYRTQMDTYESVLQKKYFSKIYEKFIYLFDINGIISM